MKNKIFVMLMGCLLLCMAAWAQNTVKGTVKDNGGEPIAFAFIKNKQTGATTRANDKGEFTIAAKQGAELEISGNNLETQTLTVNGETVEVSMKKKNEQLETVVITTALGIKRQPRELGYSTVKLSGNEVTKSRAVNAIQGLNGKVSGLNITTTNSGVFENTNIFLRGIRSLTGNNQPMLVIDGTPAPLNLLSNINPNDIADYSIIKGAAASGLYGVDASNGVIFVTTRKGTKGKPQITISNTVQLTRVAYLPKLQTRFGTGSSEDAFGRPLYTAYENQQYGPEYDGVIRPIGKPTEDGSIQNIAYAPNYKNDKSKFWNTGVTNITDVSFATQDYFISAQNAIIKGLMPGDENRRRTFRFNASKEFNKFKSSFNLNYTSSNFDVVNEGAFSGRFPNSYNGSIFFTVLQTAAHIPLTKYKNWQSDYFSQYSNYYNEYAVNPYWAIDNHRQVGRGDDLIGNVELGYDIKPWLSAVYRAGVNFSSNTSKTKAYAIETTPFAVRGGRFVNLPGFVIDNAATNSRVTSELFLKGNTSVKQFNFGYVAGTAFRERRSKALAERGNDLIVPNLFNLSNRTGEAVVNEANTLDRMLSFFGNVSVNYNKWANIEAFVRREQLSILDPSVNKFTNWGINTALVLSDVIPALKDNKYISYLKLQASYNQTGNASNVAPYSLDILYNQTNGFPIGTTGGFSAANLATDPFIRPEVVKSFEAGFELGLLNNRINLEVSAYQQNNSDQILNVQQSWATGFPGFLTNAASFKNFGLDFDLNLSPIVKIGKGRINLKTVLQLNDNKVYEVAGSIDEITIGGSAGFTQLAASAPVVSNAIVKGRPAYTFKLSDYNRTADGKIIVNGQGDPSTAANLVTMGRTLPTTILGITPSYTIGKFNFSMTWEYKGGHNVYHGIASDMDFAGISERSAAFGRQRFIMPNSAYFDGTKYVDNNNLQVSTGGINFWTSGAKNSGIATNYFTSAAAWRLREVSISYDLPLKWFGGQKVFKRVNVSANGRNLLLLLPKSNQWADPEFNYAAGNNTGGINSSFQTPASRFFGGTVLFNF
jgi:TonB-linked SusC/RagA family outer membrane protein